MTHNPFDPDPGYPEPKYFGKYKGFVRDNVDPENRGRIRCYCPQIMGPEDAPTQWLGWAETCVPWLGGLTIVSAGPPLTKAQNGNVEVGVWIEFEGGILDFPIWTGMFTIAPTTADGPPNLSTLTGAVGGSILSSPPSGSSVSDLTPPKPAAGHREIRIVGPSGIDIFLISADGGSINTGPAGVDMQGFFVRANGRSITADPSRTEG